MNSKVYVHEDMTIGDILARFPEAEEIMNDFGLHCTGCSVNAFEPIKAGVMSHGLGEDVADDIIARINELAAAKHQAKMDGIYVTARAAKKIQEFAEAEEKKGWALRISATPTEEGKEPAYAMDFEEKATKNDKSFTFHGVEILMDRDSFRLLEGADVDFVETQFASGFKITNPQFKAGGCGCGKGGCGSGGCGGGCGCK